MGYSLDICILGICLICVIAGVRRGFIRSLVHFLGAIVAAGLASVFGGYLAHWLFNTLFRDAMVGKIDASLRTMGVENAAITAEQLLANLPDFIVRALEEAGVTAASISGGLASQTGRAAVMVVDYLAPVFVNFLKVLAVIVLFFLFMTLVRVLAVTVSRMLKLPVLSQVDGLLGGVCGFLVALVVVWIIVAGLFVFTPMLEPSVQWKMEDALNHSIIAGTLVNLNPLGGMFQAG